MEVQNRFEKNMLLVLIFVMLGLSFVAYSRLVSIGELTILLLFMGIGFVGVGIFIGFNTFKYLEKTKKTTKAALWIWAVCLLAIVVLAMGWFTLTWPTYMIIEQIESVYTFPPEASGAIGLIKAVMGWFLIFMALGLLLWAFVNSQRREEVTYPVG